MGISINKSSLPALTEDQIKTIHLKSVEILESTGMWFGSDNLVGIAKKSGFRTEGNQIFFTEEDINNALIKIPSNFKLLARNPENSIDFDLNIVVAGMGRSAPFIIDRNGKRHNATRNYFVNCMKIGQSLKAVKVMGALVNPSDIPVEKMSSFMTAAQIKYSDKPYGIGGVDTLDLLARSFGIGVDKLKAGPSQGFCYAQTTVNPLSPLAMTKDQSDKLITMARSGIAICASPTPAAGSSGPCSIIGNLILNNCEVLGTIVLINLINPELPVFYGAFPCSSDMRSMNATYGGPETRKMEAASALMAKHYNLLSRSNAGVHDGMENDFQAGAESMMNFMNGFENRVNYLPGCGILAGFAMASIEKLVLDAELAGYAEKFISPVESANESVDEVVELIKKTGSKGNYLTCQHTFKNFKSELYHPELFYRASYEKWISSGKSLITRAGEKADTLLEKYKQPDNGKEFELYLDKFLN